MLTRLLDAAARLDRVVGRRLAAPLTLLDRAADLAAERLARLLAVLAVLVRRLMSDVALPLLAVAHRWAQEHVLPPSARLVDDPPRHAAPGLHHRAARGARELALASAVVLLVGVGAVSATTPHPAAPVQLAALHADDVRQQLPAPDPVEVSAARPEARVVPPEGSADDSRPSEAETPRPLELVPPALAGPAPRWLPEGTGMWLHEWTQSEGGNAGAVVDRAQAAGLSHLYVQTGSTKKGWIGEEVLSQLLPATVGTDLKVIAWDFPKLIDPEADALRMAAAATWARPGVPRVAAVAPDVETSSEGTHLSGDAVTRYYTTLRAALPPEIAVLATVPWPSEKRVTWYPYAETAAYSDAFVPMAYWYNRLPAVVTTTSMQWLAQFGLPVMPVGQGYDGRLDAPYLPEDPDPGASVQAFVDAARAGGAASVSLWSWQTTGGPQWDALVRAGAGPWPAPAPPAVAPPPPPPVVPVPHPADDPVTTQPGPPPHAGPPEDKKPEPRAEQPPGTRPEA